MRSVLECDRVDSTAFASDRHCKSYCKKTYVDANRDMRLANTRLSQARLLHGLPKNGVPNQLAEQVSAEHGAQCCCMFEAPWPEFVSPSAIGRASDEALVKRMSKHGKLTCLPMIMTSLMVSKRTRKSYGTLCKYLDANKPMTILELMQFAQAAQYLNFMMPKHPAISLTLRHKQIARIQRNEYRELEAALYDYLLDDSFKWRAWPDYPGYHFDVSRFNKILETRNKIRSALRSTIVDQSLDELAISQVLVDVAAASERVKRMNIYEFKIPDNLLNGDYDKYFLDLNNYFELPNLNCNVLGEFNKRISVYLSQMKSLLYKLHEKLVYDHMARNNQDLRQIMNSQRVYGHLLEVNCK